MSAYQRNVVVGAVVLVGLGILAWMILKFANQAASFFLTSGTNITLTSPRADGIADGSPITYKGVNVGRVTGVRRVASKTDGEDIIIDAIIEADPPLPADLIGRIRQTSLLGASATIALEPDPEAATRRSTPADASKQAILSEGATLHADYVPDITSVGDNIRDLATSLDKTIGSINEVIGDPAVKNDMKVSLANIRLATESAAKLGKRLEKVSVDLEKTTGDASETMGEVRVTVKDARAEIKKLSDNLSQRMQQVAESLQHVQSVAQKIDQGKGTAGQLVNDPKLYDSLSDTAAELNMMVKDMRRLLAQWEQEGIIKL